MTTRIGTMRCALAWTMLMAAAAPLAAQREPTLTVQLAPTAGVQALPVTRSMGNLRETLGRVTAGAPLVFNMNQANVGKGRRVQVNTHGHELVLIEEGTTDQRCEAARQAADRTLRCEEVAVIRWGSSAEFGVSSVAGVLQVTTKSPPVTKPRLRLGTTFLAHTFHRLEDVACDAGAIQGLTSCDAESSGTSWGIDLEYSLARQLAIGVGYWQTNYTVNQTFGTQQVVHDIGLRALNIYAVGRMPGARITPWGEIGMSYYDNDSDVYLDDDPPFSRGQAGPRILIGGGVDLRVTPRFDVRALLRLGGGAERDADSNYGVGFGVGYTF